MKLLYLYSNRSLATIFLTFGLIIAACGESKNTIPGTFSASRSDDERNNTRKTGKNGDKPDGGLKIGDPSQYIDGPIKVIDTKFNILVKLGNFTLCKGDIKVDVTVDVANLEKGQLLKLPDGWVSCTLIGKINLTALLGVFSTNVKMPKLKVEKGIIFVENFGTSTYDPPRPFLPSFLAAKKETLEDLDYSDDITINDSKAKIKSSGTSSIKMLGWNDTYSPNNLDRTFKKVMYFESTNTGFDDIDKVGNFLFDKLQIRMNLSPIALLSISAVGQVSGMTSFIFENRDKLPPELNTLLSLLPSKYNPSNPLSSLFAPLVENITKRIYVTTELEISEFNGPAEDDTTNDKENGKDKYGEN